MRRHHGSPGILVTYGLALAAAAGCAQTVEGPPEARVEAHATAAGHPETATFDTPEGPRTLTVLRVGEQRVFEGDILMPAPIDPRNAIDPSLASAGQSATGFRWPNNTVVYQLPADHPVRDRVLEAMQHWTRNTSIRFRERTTEPDFINFVNDAQGCSSHVGRRGGAQEINISLICSVGSTIHEIGHAVGLWHEQSRADRNAFVTIDTDCVPAESAHNFDHYSMGMDYGLYDFTSVMHYDSLAFVVPPVPASCENGQYSFWRRASPPGSFTRVAMQRDGLSFIDRQAVEEMYSEGVGTALVFGDFNGDGFRDLAVGAPRRGVEGGGRVRIYRGSATGLSNVSELAQPEPEDNDRFGQSLATGDFNGDGVADLAVGAPGEGRASGLVSVFFGSTQSAALLVYGAEVTQSQFSTEDPNERFGYALAAGDFDGDGRQDLAVGTPGQRVGAGVASAGTVMLYRGVGAGLAGWKVLTVEGLDTPEAGVSFGASLAAADFNLDGRTDLAVGAPHARQGWTAPGNGAVYLFRGGTLEGWRILRASVGGVRLLDTDLGFGFALTTGDFNGDNTPDLAVSAPAATLNNIRWAGRVFTFQSQGLDGPRLVTDTLTAPVTSQGAAFGFSLAAGRSRYASRDDLAVGAPGATAFGANAGLVYVYSPSSAGIGAPRALTQDILDVDEAGDRYGASVAFGDFDANGFADLAAGAPGEIWTDPTGQRGRAFVWRANGLTLRAFTGVGP